MDDKELHSLLFCAIQHHDESLLDDLLDGENSRKLLDFPGEDGTMLLHAAVLENDIRCVECLIRHGANPNVFDTIRARTPLHLAVELGQTDTVRAFLELEHINLDLRDDRNLTCYEIAQYCDNQSLADLIKARQNEIDQMKYDFYTIMNQACSNNQPILVRELLEEFEKKIISKLPKEWLSFKDEKVFARSSMREVINWSSSNWNDVTLLFKSASKGYTEVCKLLIEFGATAKCNDSTNYSPLYVAAYGGFTDTVKLLLDNFPSLVHEITIEKWTVLHACCLQGQSETAKLILNYPYPEELKRRFVSRSGVYEYYFAFDLNSQDAAGQTVVYLAVSDNNEKLLDTLLQFHTQAKLLTTSMQVVDNKHSLSDGLKSRVRNTDLLNKHAHIIPDRPKLAPDSRDQVSRRRVDSQLDRIIRQLRKVETGDVAKESSEASGITSDNEKYLICPFEMDTYCDYNSKTALQLAVCQQYHTIATTLLVNGANPNLPILSRDSFKSDFSSLNIDTGLNWLRSSKSTCLKEACRLNDETMCEILIRYGAVDNQDNLALQVAATNKNSRLISKFLALKSNVDPEYKINKKCNVEFASRYKQTQKLSKSGFGNSTTTFSSMFPSTPVMIDWQNLKCIQQIEPQWLIDASLVHNKKLKHATTSLLSITRLDLSSNNLKSIHPVIFRLPSLRELDLSNNRIESLLDISHRKYLEGDVGKTSKLIESHRTAMKRSKSTTLSSVNLESSNIIDLNEPQDWDLPYLETLDLHDNLLISLPDCLFELPRLSELDVSSNQLRQLPWSMWTAPALKEVIASSNLLDDLPKLPMLSKHSMSPSILMECSDSPTDGRSSLTSNQSIAFEGGESSFNSSIGYDANKDQPADLHSSPFESMNFRFECTYLPLSHLNHWKRKIELVNSFTVGAKTTDEIGDELPSVSKINYLNLSHNSFAHIPPALACIATSLTRLNLSYNRIISLGDINLYPVRIKNIDLSNNQITSWFTIAQEDAEFDQCYADFGRQDCASKSLYGSFCHHKSHQKLENLKSLNLSNNNLKSVQIFATMNSNDQSRNSIVSKDSYDSSSNTRGLLLYPNITALDLSFNRIQHIPKCISDLKDLSVFNLSGNIQISLLPPELGLASKLWNLGINGCNLNEPLKSIVESKTNKTMDIIGYLRSILEEARPYARMKLMLVGLQGIGKTSLLEQMRQEGSSGLRRRVPEHWTKRMGHATRSNIRNQKGVTLSTVGVDIHDWVYCKRTPRNQSSFGPVSFSTWDFGGQQEFYATHRYFLSKRSMYLVVWRLTDGINGILGIQQWLVNIQSRASGSPVIIVGTHEDMVEGGENGEIIRQLQEEIRKRFIAISDHDKCGLPQVMDSIVISTKTKLNIKNLCNRIYDIVFSLKCPGSSERLLEQKIPATYLYLEEIINWIVHDRLQKKREPVLTYDEYKKMTSEQLKTKYNKVFRDLEPINSREINYNSELHQATRFLHENGVLLHYEDANLRDLYFLDPQWLCDILSNVVTIREINPHIKNGLMKIDDLGFLFKSIDMNLNGGIQSYVVNLLNKFEVALTWNTQYLLIPSLLPSDPEAINNQQDFQVKMPPRARGRSVIRRLEPSRIAMRATSIDRSGTKGPHLDGNRNFEIEFKSGDMIYRLILLRYLPAGFLARLQSGILSDPIFDEVCADIHSNLTDQTNDVRLTDFVGNRASWTCWKGGIQLTLQDESTINSHMSSKKSFPLITIQDINTMDRASSFNQENFKVECTQNIIDDQSEYDNVRYAASKWCDFDITQYSNIIKISIPDWILRVTNETGKVEFIKPDHQNIAKLMAQAVEHIDNLLEDWYPSLGTRFAHTLGGNYLVTRMIPCSACFTSISSDKSNQRSSRFDSRSSRLPANKTNFSITTAVGIDVVETLNSKKILNESREGEIYCFYLEHCILNAYNLSSSTTIGLAAKPYNLNQPSNMNQRKTNFRNLKCPQHGSISLGMVAPDIIFDDVQDYYKIESEQIDRCKLIGRGTFGFVFKGSIRCSNLSGHLGISDQEVALKLLQPVDPCSDADQADVAAYKTAKSNWIREPIHSACRSYCTARHEINILQTLRHPNIVLFIGLCIKPLAIVLELAPLGCLTDVLKNYKRAGMRIDQYSLRKTIIQVARALEFLHQQRVIYRDLKAENVLVWSFPSPFATNLQSATVELKLADYGISRQALSTGIWKGFAGTINFLAPEILRHNGDEEYTEKVDCFSFGIFVYELLTLRPPFKHNEGMKSHLADGARPTLSMRDLIYPNHMIDLMSVCWSQEPHHRPTASQIVSIASTPEFMQLLDVVALSRSHNEITFCNAIQYMHGNESNLDLWLGKDVSTREILGAKSSHWLEYQQLTSLVDSKFSVTVSCSCVVAKKIWLCDTNLVIHAMDLTSRSSGKDSKPACKNQSFNSDEVSDRIQSFPLKVTNQNAFVRQMIFVKLGNCVIMLLSDGSIWLCRLDNMAFKQLDDSSIKFQCVTVQETYDANVSQPDDQLALSSEESFHLFCGQSNGISCLEVLDGSIYRQNILPLASNVVDLSGERIVEPSQSTEVTSIVASKDLLWTAAGCTVHLWSRKEKRVARKLDCWKLVPCSESLESINIENYYQQARSSVVSSLVYLNNQLFVGTSHGCFMVVEADSLKPVIVFRPYESSITILVPIIFKENNDDECTKGGSDYLVTVGSGYRDLMKRYVNSLDGCDGGPMRTNINDVAILWSANYYDL